MEQLFLKPGSLLGGVAAACRSSWASCAIYKETFESQALVFYFAQGDALWLGWKAILFVSVPSGWKEACVQAFPISRMWQCCWRPAGLRSAACRGGCFLQDGPVWGFALWGCCACRCVQASSPWILTGFGLLSFSWDADPLSSLLEPLGGA